MKLVRLHNPEEGVLDIVGFMSGTGTNLKKVIDREKQLSNTPHGSPFHVCAIFSDKADSAAPGIGRDYDIPVLIRDRGAFYSARGKHTRDLSIRSLYDAETVRMLAPFNAKFAVYAGYMSIASPVLIEAFTGINVHPGDLSVTSGGKRRWVGDRAVYDAIRAGEPSLRSTTHIVETAVDCGRILMISRPLPVTIPGGTDIGDPEQAKTIASEHQARLKETGDWEILPLTVEYIASGRYSKDESGNLYFDSEPIPEGVKL